MDVIPETVRAVVKRARSDTTDRHLSPLHPYRYQATGHLLGSGEYYKSRLFVASRPYLLPTTVSTAIELHSSGSRIKLADGAIEIRREHHTTRDISRSQGGNRSRRVDVGMRPFQSFLW
jgi:hypothetical protein